MAFKKKLDDFEFEKKSSPKNKEAIQLITHQQGNIHKCVDAQ